MLRNKETQGLFKGYEYPPVGEERKATKSTFQTNSSLVQIPDEILRRVFREPRKSK